MWMLGVGSWAAVSCFSLCVEWLLYAGYKKNQVTQTLGGTSSVKRQAGGIKKETTCLLPDGSRDAKSESRRMFDPRTMELPFTESTARSQGTQRRPQRSDSCLPLGRWTGLGSGGQTATLGYSSPKKPAPPRGLGRKRVNEKNRCLGWVNPATRSTTRGSWNNQLLSPAFQGHVSAEGKALGRVWARGNQLSSRCAPPTPNPGQRQLPGFSEARRAPPCVAVIAGFN